MLQHWRANIDIQIIVDITACARYLAKYVSKSEPRSKAASEVFSKCVHNLPSTSSSSTIFRKCLIQSVGERDYSAQETAHLLLSLPLYSCTYNFINVSLDGHKQIRTQRNADDTALTPSILDIYGQRSKYLAKHPTLMSFNLIQFASTFSSPKNDSDELNLRSNPVIVKTFPNYSEDPNGPNYALYCKFQLIKLKPWQISPNTLWNTDSPTDDTFTTLYHQFLQSNSENAQLQNHIQQLQQAEQYVRAYEHSNDDSQEYQSSSHQEEWMLLCQLNPLFSQQDNDDGHTDWEAAANELSPQLLLSCPNWISNTKTQYNQTLPSRQFNTIDINNLNHKQRQAYTIVSIHFNNQDEHKNPLRMMILGTAGTGKSYLIRSLSQLLGHKCLLTATTGIAAFNIGGITIHSALQLPVQSHNQNDLTGHGLASLQLKLNSIHYIIIDEVSMLGQRMMSWIDRRLRQASGHIQTPFGGYSLILIGDFAQLPPVGDRPLYVSDEVPSHGHTMYHLFNKVVILSDIVRQQGHDVEQVQFKALLTRLRDGQTTEEDWAKLLTRTPTNASDASRFDDAIHLFYNKDKVNFFNVTELNKLSTPIARINAIHSSSLAAAAKSDDAGGLDSMVLLAKGARVMLICNLWQQTGLCNGATGVVDDILYSSGQKPPHLPIAVLVHFYDYSGPAFIANKPKCIPIPPHTFEWSAGSTRLSRQQIPLRLCYAITIHKSQGQTLNKAVIDIGDKEMAAGSTFVAISRLRSLKDGLFQPMSFERLTSINRLKRFQQRLAEEERLHLLELDTQNS